MEKINIIVVGASGKMGQAIIKETLDDSDLNLAMAVDIITSPRIGIAAGDLLGFESNIKISSEKEAKLKKPDLRFVKLACENLSLLLKKNERIW